MGKRWDVEKGDRFLVLDEKGDLIRGVCWADEDAQIYSQIYVHSPILPLRGGKRANRCAVRWMYGPFTVVPFDGRSNRVDLICSLVKKFGWTQGAEIGVCKGSTSFPLLDRNPKLHMTFVDYWPGNYKRHELKFRRRLSRYPDSRYTLIMQDSTKAAQSADDNSLDFAFIDADHSEEACGRDILAWLPKIKSDGMLLGHDANWDTVRAACDKHLAKYEIFQPDDVWMAWKKDQV